MKKSDQKILTEGQKMLREEVIGKIKMILEPGEALRDLAGKVSDFKAEVETIRDEAQEKLDNMTDRARDGEKGEEAQATIDAADEIVTELDQAETSLQADAVSTDDPEELKELLEAAVEGLENAAEKISEL